ncbi:MAG: HPr kinase/phosphatase C-terminal domain-containing protein [Gammaproteobacteria bacterium]|nr:HPr kinase/phosphatase C-terminal domain-containing protein [Gammaproteobacteria bacterium]
MINELPAHGVLIQFDGLGVYLIGSSGIGKSETALQLIYQGAVLICDDAPDFTCEIKNGELLGICPAGFHGLMHLRDLGIINIMELLGAQCFKASQRIDFVLELIQTDEYSPVESHLNPRYQLWQFKNGQHKEGLHRIKQQQSRSIPGQRIHLYPNRNIPLLVKTAVMQFALYKKQVHKCTPL